MTYPYKTIDFIPQDCIKISEDRNDAIFYVHQDPYYSFIKIELGKLDKQRYYILKEDENIIQLLDGKLDEASDNPEHSIYRLFKTSDAMIDHIKELWDYSIGEVVNYKKMQLELIDKKLKNMNK